MKQPRSFDCIVLDAAYARYEVPMAYKVFVSDNGRRWGKPVAQGVGTETTTVIPLSQQRARFIKIVNSNRGQRQPWSIYEFRVYQRASN